MACPSYKEKISSYLDGQLGPEEKAEVDGHLKSCSRCREYYDELSLSVSRLKNLQEVEPPPWLKQKVMARIREEAGSEKRFWKRLLYPLQVKIPVGAVATIAIAVITLYIFKASEPEVRLAKAPQDETARTGMPAEVKPEGSERTGVQKRAAEEPREQPAQEKLLPAKEKAMPGLLMKKAEPQPQAAAPAVGELRAKVSEGERKAAAPEGRALPQGPVEKDAGGTFGYQAETALPGDGRVREEAKKSILPAPASLPAKKDLAVGGVAQDALKREQAVAAPAARASAEMKEAAVSLAVFVKNLETGDEEIRKAVRTAGGTIVREEPLERKRRLFISILSQQYTLLLEKLQGIGEMEKGAPRQVEGTGPIIIRIEVVQINQ